MSEYKSQGTVSCYVGSADTHINFVPHGDYTIRHEGQNYAVFLRNGGSDCISRSCKDKDGKLVDVLIKTPTDLSSLSNKSIFIRAHSAVMTHSKVEVEVRLDGRDLTLINIVSAK